MPKKKKNKFLRNLLCAPFTWILIIPLIFLDIFTELYRQITFRLYKIPLVKRSHYLKIDRHKLKYLSFPNKISCAYCGYAIGLINYISEIGARTEKYWCPIKHKQSKNFINPKYHKKFAKYGDEKAFRKFKS